MSEFQDLKDRWKLYYRAQMVAHKPYRLIDDKQLDEMAHASALRNTAPPFPVPKPAPAPVYPPDSLSPPPLLNWTMLRKKAEEVFDLSYLDEFWLYKAWHVIQRKVVPKFMNGNTMLTILGCIAGALTYLQSALANGTAWPQKPQDWVALMIGALLAAIGVLAKAASVGAKPDDPQTKEQIAGKLERGEKVPQTEISRSVDASRVVDSLAK